MVKWEYKVGPLTVNFRVLLEPKGFLRIIVLVSKQAKFCWVEVASYS